MLWLRKKTDFELIYFDKIYSVLLLKTYIQHN